MINEKYAKKFCNEDISKIENYDKAVNDTTQTWHCHHRDEVKVLPSGMTVLCSRQDLIDNDRYYNCPANELIFLTKSEHHKLHGTYKTTDHRRKIGEANKGKTGYHHSEETRRKMSESNKGKTSHYGITTSIFGKAFKERYGLTRSDDNKLYMKEYNYYVSHNNKFSWENNYAKI